MQLDFAVSVARDVFCTRFSNMLLAEGSVTLFSYLLQLFVDLFQNARVVREWTFIPFVVRLIVRRCTLVLSLPIVSCPTVSCVVTWLATLVAVVTAIAGVVGACLFALTILHAKFDSRVVIDDMYRFVEGFGSPVLQLTG
jgi:flagellar biosynthesis protein FliQ